MDELGVVDSILDGLIQRIQDRYEQNMQNLTNDPEQINNWIADMMNMLEHMYIILNIPNELVKQSDDEVFVPLTPRMNSEE